MRSEHRHNLNKCNMRSSKQCQTTLSQRLRQRPAARIRPQAKLWRATRKRAVAIPDSEHASHSECSSLRRGTPGSAQDHDLRNRDTMVHEDNFFHETIHRSNYRAKFALHHRAYGRLVIYRPLSGMPCERKTSPREPVMTALVAV